MKKRLQQLNIQAKLFALFGFIAIIGAITVGSNFLTIFLINRANTTLFELSEHQMELYQGIKYLQNIGLAQESYALSYEFPYLDDYASSSTLLREFIQRKQLEAGSAAETEAYYTLDRSLQEHQDLLLSIVRASFPEPDATEIERLRGEAQAVWETMLTQLNGVMETNLQKLQAINQQNAVLQNVTTVLTILSLIVFAILTLVVALVIHRQAREPVHQLTTAAQAMTRSQTLAAQGPGEEAEPIPLAPPVDLTPLHGLADRSDEIGQLAQTFIRMTQEIETQEQSLAQQARELREQIAGRR